MLLRPAIAGLTSARARQHPGHLAGDPRLYLDRPVSISRLPCVFVAGAAMTITGVGAQTLIQAAVEVGMRGRIMALYGMIFRAGPAVGAVLMGSLSERFGLRLPLAVGALVSCGFWLWTRLKQKRIAATLEADPAAAEPRPRRPRQPVMTGRSSFLFRSRLHARWRWRAGSPAEGWVVSGTCRTAEKAAALREAGFRVQVFRPRPSPAAGSVGRGNASSRVGAARCRRRPGAGDAWRRHRRDRAACPGSAISRRPASTATAAAAGSTRPPRCRRPASAAAAGSPPSKAGSTCGAAAGCRSISSGSPAIYGPGRSAFDALRAGTAKRIDKPGQVFSRIHVDDLAQRADRLDAAALGRVRSTMSATTNPRRPRRSSPTPRRCSACRRRRSCRSKPPGSRRWRAASTTTTSGSRTA